MWMYDRCDVSHRHRSTAKEAATVPSEQMSKYDEFYNSARHDNSFDTRTTTLIHLAAAMALGCEP